MRDIIYNKVRLNEYIKIKDIKESLLPEVINSSIKIKNKLGSRFINQELGVRKFTIDFEIIADTLLEKQDTINILAPLFFTRDEKELVIDNDRRYNAIIDGSSDIENIMYDGLISITLVAHNPIALGDRIKIPINNNEKLFNNGNYESEGFLNFKATGGYSKVKLNGGNPHDYVKIYNLKNNDSVTIDMEKEVVVVNGKYRSLDVDILGDYFAFPAGEFSVNLEGCKSVELGFAERWL